VSTTLAAPEGTKTAGARLWGNVTEAYDLEPHELELLAQAVNVLDVCAELQATVTAQGLLTDDKVHPATVELRLQRVLLVKLLADLRFPEGEDGARPQRRTGSRGAYGRREGE